MQNQHPALPVAQRGQGHEKSVKNRFVLISIPPLPKLAASASMLIGLFSGEFWGQKLVNGWPITSVMRLFKQEHKRGWPQQSSIIIDNGQGIGGSNKDGLQFLSGCVPALDVGFCFNA